VSTELELQTKTAELRHQRDLGKTQIVRGSTLLLAIPVVGVAMLALLFAFDSIWPVLVWVLYLLAGGSWGVSSVVIGASQMRSSTRKLKQLEVERLPPARLLT